MTDFKSINDARYEAAAAWHARLDTIDAGEDDWHAFTAWLEADPQNRHAFDAVAEAAADVEAQKQAIAAALNEGPGQDTNVISLAALRPASARASRRVWMASAVAAAAAILVAVFVLPPVTEAPQPQAWATGVGEHRTVKLKDGSEIQLNTDTALHVAFTRNSRNATLEKGEAHFDVVSNPARPFTVAVGDRRVEVVGTAFNILRNGGAISITVTRGIVKVAPAAGTHAGDATKLAAGDQYRGNEGQAAFQVARVDPAQALAWLNGRLIFDNTPLFQVVAELNRYFDRKVTISDTETGALRFTGVLKIDDEDRVLKRLAGLLSVTVQSRGDDLVLVRGSSD